MAIHADSLGSVFSLIFIVSTVISICIGLYLVFTLKKFNEDVFRRVQGTPAEIHFQKMSPNHYLISQIIVIAIAIVMLNIIGALICLIVTPYLKQMSLKAMGLDTPGVEQPKSHEISFDD